MEEGERSQVSCPSSTLRMRRSAKPSTWASMVPSRNPRQSPRPWRWGCGEARGNHGDDEVAAAVAVGSEDTVEPDLAQRAEDGGGVTVRQRAAKVNTSGAAGAEMTVPPLSRALKPSRRLGGQRVRLHSVRFLTFPPSR